MVITHNSPQTVLDDPSINYPQSILDDLTRSARLCELRIRVDKLRQKSNAAPSGGGEKQKYKVEIKRLNTEIRNEVAEYDDVFKFTINRRLYQEKLLYVANEGNDAGKVRQDQVERVLSLFYEKRITSSKTLCNYLAKNNASLKTFLLSSLRKHILSTNQEIQRERDKNEISINHLGDDDKNKSIMPPEPDTDPIEDSEQKELLIEVLTEAIDCLGTSDPLGAEIVRLRLRGMEYEHIVRKFESSEDDLKKQIVNYRQKHTRAINKLHILLSIILSRRKLCFDSDLDFINLSANRLEEQKRLCDEVINEALLKLSEVEPEAACNAGVHLNNLSTIDTIRLFSTLGGSKVTMNRSPEINKLDKIVRKVLYEKQLVMTIERGTPVIKSINK